MRPAHRLASRPTARYLFDDARRSGCAEPQLRSLTARHAPARRHDMNSTARKSAGASSGRAASPRPFAGGVARFAHRQAGGDRARAIRARPGSPRHFPARASSTATRRCSTDPEVDAVYIADAASRPRRMGDQGGGGRQACAGRKADGAHRLRGRRDDPCGPQGRHLPRRGLHVPPASADREARSS